MLRSPSVERFWFPLEHEVLLRDGGFLADPLGKYGEIFAKGATPLAEIRKHRTVILLGEPGMGKSTVIGEIRASGAEDTTTACFDLKSFSAEQSLERVLRTNSAVLAWMNEGSELELFLDSFDECAIPSKATVIPRVLADLVSEPVPALRRAASDRESAMSALSATESRALVHVQLRVLESDRRSRLKVRIVSRSGAYLPSFGAQLSATVDGPLCSPVVFKLAPLRRNDAVSFVSLNDGDPDKFLQEVFRAGVSILAAIPITLRLLFEIFRKSGELPKSIAEIYRLGIRALCEEPNELRGQVDPDTVVASAQALAFLSVVGGKSEIWTGRESDRDSSSQLWLGEGLTIKDSEDSVQTLEQVREAVSTSLFSPSGDRTVSWSHWSFAEYLAASFLSQRHLSLGQLTDILVHPPTGHVFTTLQETAAWLASMNRNFLDWIVEHDPQVILRTDVSGIDPDSKSKIVAALLTGFEIKGLRDDIGMRDHYVDLLHPGLADQLRPWILDRSKDIVVRRVAIDIAERCELSELESELAALALEETEDAYTRAQAAGFVARVGSFEARKRLRPLAFGEAGDDCNDDLRGLGLRACWPDSMTIDEVLACLVPEKRSIYFGCYAGFVEHDFREHFKVTDLPKALLWVQTTIDQRSIGWHLDKLRNWIVTTALKHLVDREVLEPLAGIVHRCLSEHWEVFDWDEDIISKEDFDADALSRRTLVSEIIRQASPLCKEADVFSIAGLCTGGDFGWALGQAVCKAGDAEERYWASLARWLHYWPAGPEFDQVWNAAQFSKGVDEYFAHILEPVRLGSDEARELARQYRERQKWSAPERRPRKDRKLPRALHDALSRAKEDLEAFWLANKLMAFDENGHANEGQFVEPDVRKLPGWQTLSNQEKQWWPKLCCKFVADNRAREGGWDERTVFHPDIAGYRAIRFLLEADETFVAGQSDSFFGSWAPAVVMMAGQTFGEVEDLDKRLIELFVQRSTKEMLKVAGPLIDRESSASDYPRLIQKLKGAWREEIDQFFLEKLSTGSLSPAYEANLLAEMVALESEGAREIAESRITSFRTGDADSVARRLGAAKALLGSAQEGGWAVLRPALKEDVEFCSQVLSKTVHGSREPAVPDLVRRLGVNGALELYRLICRTSPYRDDDPNWEGGFVDSVQGMRMFRDELMRHIVSIGTEESHAALKDLAYEDPPMADMSWLLVESEINLRRNTWKPLSTEDLAKLVSTTEGRIVNSEQQLIEVVLTALQAIDKGLRDEIRLLWNIPGKGEDRFDCHPKEEGDFADYVRERLDERVRRRGIITNREVQVRRHDKTDILIEAIKRGPMNAVNVVSVTVEVKCSWNGELEKAMETQLLSKYLESDKRNSGIYLVGWFESVKWTEEQNKRKKNKSRILAEPRLLDQAVSLSGTGSKRIAYVGIDCSLP